MNSVMDRALQMLNELIDGGREYPDAEFKVVWELDLSDFEVDQLRELYDGQ